MSLRALRSAPLLLLLLAACEKDGGTPSFLRVVGPTVTNPSGSTVVPSGISDIWVFANDKAIGVWQADRRIPVLASGSTTIKLVAGVRRNGVTSDRIQYPFYATWQQDVDLTLGQEVSVQPVFRYYADEIWSEGFETGQAFNISEGDTGLVILNDPLDVRVGDKSAGIFLDTAHTLFRAISQASPTFPNGTEPTFLEIDYKSDTRFLVGGIFELGGQLQAIPYVFVSPTGSMGTELPWRHIYIDLQAAWGSGATVNRQFYIQAQLENGATSAKIILDNLTVHH